LALACLVSDLPECELPSPDDPPPAELLSIAAASGLAPLPPDDRPPSDELPPARLASMSLPPATSCDAFEHAAIKACAPPAMFCTPPITAAPAILVAAAAMPAAPLPPQQ
jgi:hypothetical protein